VNKKDLLEEKYLYKKQSLPNLLEKLYIQ